MQVLFLSACLLNLANVTSKIVLAVKSALIALALCTMSAAAVSVSFCYFMCIDYKIISMFYEWLLLGIFSTQKYSLLSILFNAYLHFILTYHCDLSIIFVTDMCPKPNDTQTELSKSSYVEELPDNVPGLFAALTGEPDPQKRWLSITYPVDLDISAFQPAPERQLVYHLRKCI